MKFVVTSNRSVKNWPCRIPVPQDGGTVQIVRVGFDFTLPPADKYQNFITEKLAEAEGDVMKANQLLTDYIAEHITGWHGFVDEDEKTELEFTPETLKLVLKMSNALTPLNESFAAAIEGRKVKN